MSHDEYAPPPLALDFNPNHTLGFLISDWIEAHCLVPSGVYFNQPLVLNGWQLFCNANHYRVKATAPSGRAVHLPSQPVGWPSEVG